MSDALSMPSIPLQRPLPRAPGMGDDAASVRRAAQEFEAMVLAEFLTPIFDGVDVDGLGGGGAGEAMFRPMLVQEYARQIAASGGVGFADAVLRELTALQAAEPPETR